MTATTEIAATTPTVTDAIDQLVANAQQALQAYGSHTQDSVNLLVKKASVAALSQHGVLAAHAVKETGRGWRREGSEWLAFFAEAHCLRCSCSA